MKTTIEVTDDQLLNMLRGRLGVPELRARTDFANAPDRILGWCEFPAGREWRVCRRSGSAWMAGGCSQNVVFWAPMPDDPR